MTINRRGGSAAWAWLLPFAAVGFATAGSARQNDDARVLASAPSNNPDRDAPNPVTAAASATGSSGTPYRIPGGDSEGDIGPSQPHAVASLGACKVKGTLRPAEVRIGYLKLANAQLIAKAQGLHEEAMCVPVRWIGFETGGQVNAAIGAGQIDFGAMGGPPASVGVTRRLGYRGILLLNMLQGVEGLAVRPTIATPADLAGKQIATPFGSTSHCLLSVLLKQAGLSTASVSLRDMTPGQAAAAWTAGQIDGAYVWEPALGRMVAQGGTILVDNAEMADRGYPMWDISVVSDAFARNYPDFVASYVRSECAAIDAWRTDAEATAAGVASELSLSLEEARRMVRGTGVVPCSQQTDPAYLGDASTPGALSRSIYDMAVFLRDNGRTQSLAQPADYEALIDTRYLVAIRASRRR
jgi:taurine transport system substrate-binding protein